MTLCSFPSYYIIILRSVAFGAIKSQMQGSSLPLSKSTLDLREKGTGLTDESHHSPSFYQGEEKLATKDNFGFLGAWSWLQRTGIETPF